MAEILTEPGEPRQELPKGSEEDLSQDVPGQTRLFCDTTYIVSRYTEKAAPPKEGA
jgi:hypothetical protein